ncbi:MAG: methyltransferase domain-containing protein [Phormidesmis sp.]
MGNYKQQVLNDFNHRSSDSDFHRRFALRLVDFAGLKAGQRVLDVATGTGLAAIPAAQAVGPTGYVVGTDFAVGMLQQARRKVEPLNLTNIAFEEADADEQALQESQFDTILCSSAIVYFVNIPVVLRRWYAALKPEGRVAFSCFAETSPSAGVLFRAVVRSHGIVIPNPNELLGKPDRCRQNLKTAGFSNIEIVTEQFGSYLQEGERAWNGNANSAFGLQQASWSAEELAHCKQAYLAEINKASTEKGYWNDMTAFFVTAQKS